jgi:DNA polymerase (family 10)
MTDRLAVAAALHEIALLLQMKGGSPHRWRAYDKGARALESLERDLAAMTRAGQLTEIPGIGPGLARTITELVETGRSPMLEELRGQLPPGVVELATVLSLPKIQAVHEALGVASLAGLEQAAREGRLRAVKGFGPRTEEKVLEQIHALSRRGEQSLLHHGEREGLAALAYARALPGVERAELAGAVRRRLEVVDRLELVIAAHEPGRVLEALSSYPAAAARLDSNARSGAWRLAAGMNMEAEVVPPDAFAVGLHRRTGSPRHREALAIVAEARGFTFDAAGLHRGGRPVPVASEEDLYRLLELPFMPAELREDGAEVEAAVRGALPERLLRVEDVRGMVHCHTVYSDGKHTVEQMARAAEAMGMSYITITDHSPTASYAGGLSLDRLHRQWDEIDRVQQKVKVRLLRGSEVDILREGELDWPDSVLEQMDVVVASIHNRYRLDEDAMTRRVIRGLRHPLFKIWGHALGRYVLRRPPISARVPEILEAAAESRVAIEINGNPNRLDLEPRWVREARRLGLRFTVSVDAHSTAELHHLRWAVDMARRGWLTPDDVLNTLEPEAFAAAVRPVAAPAVA